MTAAAALWRDVTFGARLLRRSPVFTAAAVLTLALGVGANAVTFSVVNAFILRPLPVRDADRLVVVATHDRSSRTLRGVSFADVQDYRAASAGVFEDVAAYRVGFVGLAVEGGSPERVLVTWVTGNYFPLLDIRPGLGRFIRGDEGDAGRIDEVVVLGHSTWQLRFGGDPSVVGRIVRVNGRPCTIIGVGPPGFLGTFAFSDSELYLPLNWSDPGVFETRRSRGLHALARLEPDVSLARAQVAMNVVAERLMRQYPDSNADVAIRVLPERLARPEEDQFRSNALGAAIMLVLVGLVTILAAVNVINLLLARATGRGQEFAIRAALGAARGRLVRQMVTEGLMLAVLGGAAGVLLGTWVAQALAAIRLPGDLPVRFDFQLDWRVLAYTAMVVLGTGLLVGFVPAMRASSANVGTTLRQSGRGSPAGPGGHRIRATLVVAQVAICFVLLVAAGLAVRSLFAAEGADLGFRPDGVLNIHMDVGQLGYTEAQGRAFFDDVNRRVQAMPGVEFLSFAFTIPMGYIRVSDTVEAEGEQPGINERVSPGKNIVSPRYFQTMGIEVVRGRSFSEADNEQSRPVAIVNQHLAELLWPGRDPLGRRFRSAGRSGPWIEVVGVTNTSKYRFLFEDPQPYFYVPMAQQYTGLRVLHVRTSMPLEALAPAIEREILAREPNLVLYNVQSMAQALGGGLGFFPVRVATVSAATVGLLGLALAVVGVFGVVSYLVSQRTHEIGVRMALGATQHDILRLVFRDGLNLIVFGLAVGWLVALACSNTLENFLFGVSVRDAVTYGTVTTTLVCVAVVACAIPAWQATRVTPTVALRSE